MLVIAGRPFQKGEIGRIQERLVVEHRERRKRVRVGDVAHVDMLELGLGRSDSKGELAGLCLGKDVVHVVRVGLSVHAAGAKHRRPEVARVCIEDDLLVTGQERHVAAGKAVGALEDVYARGDLGRRDRGDRVLRDGADWSGMEEALQALVREKVSTHCVPRRVLRADSLLALLVGVFLIFNAISFSIVQRRRLLGRLRAIGVSAREIRRLVMLEALVLAILGTMVGTLLGAWLGAPTHIESVRPLAGGMVNVVRQREREQSHEARA